jgi:Winged helix-turn-helix DNA-binding
VRIDSLYVDEIRIDDAGQSGIVKPTHYEFQESTWVSVHANRTGQNIGPVTVIDQYDVPVADMEISERRLSTEGSPPDLVVTFNDSWTIPNMGMYALVFPRYFVPREKSFTASKNRSLELGITRSNQLFYYCVFTGRRLQWHQFSISVKIEPDEQQFHVLASSIEAFRHRADGTPSPKDASRILEQASPIRPELPAVTDPTDRQILDWVTADPTLKDQAIGQRLNISRQAANTRRRKLEAMGYKVR